MRREPSTPGRLATLARDCNCIVDADGEVLVACEFHGAVSRDTFAAFWRAYCAAACCRGMPEPDGTFRNALTAGVTAVLAFERRRGR